MGPPRPSNSRKPSKDTHSQEGRKDKKNNSAPAPLPRRRAQDHQKQPNSDENQNQIELSSTIPLTLQQLLLNVFKAALLHTDQDQQQQLNVEENDEVPTADSSLQDAKDPVSSMDKESQLDIKSLIQTIKSHLYNRDFDSAFADATEELLRAYALRWSATRALGYTGMFKSLLGELIVDHRGSSAWRAGSHIVCIGGGAGAEIVALAGALRDLMDEESKKDLSDALNTVSLDTDNTQGASYTAKEESTPTGLSITAVDIADWSSVVKRLSSTILSPTIPSTKSHPAPLLQQNLNSDGFKVDFKRLDILSLPDETLGELYHFNQPSQSPTKLVTLMFTLNELFSTSMSKATAFLLRTTDLLQPGTILLVVDSPGSYSTLKLGKGGGTGFPQERQYPMKFLLDHTLLSVAKGKWERIFSQDSRWWRRDAARLWYDVGEGAGLEDMRFQIHVYRRL